MTATHYQSSRGPQLIATMPHPHLVNAHAKLVREGDPSRAAEIEAMAAQIAINDAEHAELADGRAEADEPNPRVVIGDNGAPEATPFEAISAHADDLLIEVRNWADGAEITNQAQADEVARLLDDVQAAAKAADEARKVEVAPIDKIRDEIQGRYNAYIAPEKNKTPGKLTLAAVTLKAALGKWLRKLDEEKRAAAAEAQRIADQKAAEARAAMQQAALAGDFGGVEQAEILVAEAGKAIADAKKAAQDKAHAAGDGRARGLRSYWAPVMTDPKAALVHYMAQRPDDLKAFLLDLARQDVQRGLRTIPGFTVQEERRVA